MKKPIYGKKSQLVSERFRLVEYIKSGGQGEVWKAHDITQNNKVLAVKLFSPESKKRAKDEVQALIDIKNQNVIGFVDADVDSNNTNKVHFLAMEYAKNKTLFEYDYFKGDINLSIELFCRICEGVLAIHEAGYVHRDLKPSNILVCKDQRDLKVGDFGLCLPPEDSNRTKTSSRENVGPIYFSAPEQTSNPPSPTHKSDIYSLGRTLHWMITGEYKHIPSDPYKPVSEYLGMNTQLEIDSLIKKMVSQSPSDRPESVENVLSILRKNNNNLTESKKINLSADQTLLFNFIKSDGGASKLESLVEHMAILEGVLRPKPYERHLTMAFGNEWKTTAKRTLNSLRQMANYQIIIQEGNNFFFPDDESE